MPAISRNGRQRPALTYVFAAMGLRAQIEALATSTDLSIRAIQKKIAGRASRGIVGEITKRARATQPQAL